MVKKRIFTHVSKKAAAGLQRLSASGEVRILAAPNAGGYTVVTVSRDGRDSFGKSSGGNARIR
jgi:hypothetical protein